MRALTIAADEQFLRQISKEVQLNDLELLDNIATLEDYCKEHAVMAMAAVQLGIPKRLVYLKNTNLEIIKKMQKNIETEEDKQYNEARVLINPVIISREGLTDYWEACASCLDNIGHVFRPYRMTIQYQDIKGNIYTDVFEGFEATVLSHELDHLDGILHMDIAQQVLIMPKEERKKFRQEHGYNITFKEGNYNDLVKSLVKEKKLELK